MKFEQGYNLLRQRVNEFNENKVTTNLLQFREKNRATGSRNRRTGTVFFEQEILANADLSALLLPLQGNIGAKKIVVEANISQFRREGNICCKNKFCLSKTRKMFFSASQYHFRFPDTNFAFETYVAQFSLISL